MPDFIFSGHKLCVLQQANELDGKDLQQTYRKAQSLAKQIQSAGGQAAEEWDTIFEDSASRPDAAVLTESIVLLHERKQFDAAVEGMLSAIRNDMASPWMYDVLAVEMKLANRPAKDIARVLQSRTDFATSDISQLLLTAALMSRFEAWDQAIAVCREATELNPENPDVWLFSRSVADKSENPESRAWARCGILKHVWTNDAEVLHGEARKVLRALTEECDRTNQSALGQKIRELAQQAQAVDLQVRMNWIGPADLDLLITEPNGEVCSFRNRFTKNSGRLIREDGVTEDRRNGNRHLEHYVNHTALTGDYEIAVRFVLGSAPTGTAQLEIIQHAGTSRESRTLRTVRLAKEDVKVTVSLTDGRAMPLN
jgi:tetratricopeptide (TPR) repeat protein